MQTTIAKQALGTLLLMAAGRGLALTAAVALARLMGPQQFGYYSTALALVAILGVPSSLGLPTLVVRLIASYRAKGSLGLMRGLVRRAHQIVGGMSVLIGVVAGGVLAAWSLITGTEIHTAYWLSLLILPVSGIAAVRSAVLRGLGNVVHSMVPISLLLPGAQLAVLAAWWFSTPAQGSMSADMGIAARIVGEVAVLVTVSALFLNRVPSGLSFTPPEFQSRQWTRSALPLLAMGGMTLINNRLDLLMLGALAGPAPAGLYQVSVRAAELVALVLLVANLVAQPRIARLFALEDTTRLQRLVSRMVIATTAGAAPLAFALVMFGDRIIGFAFGGEYIGAAGPTAILALAQFGNAATGSVALILTMTGHERLAAVGTAVGAGTNIVLNALLIPQWGVFGAAIATGISLVIWNVVEVHLVFRATGLRPSILGAIFARRPAERRLK